MKNEFGWYQNFPRVRLRKLPSGETWLVQLSVSGWDLGPVSLTRFVHLNSNTSTFNPSTSEDVPRFLTAEKVHVTSESLSLR